MEPIIRTETGFSKRSSSGQERPNELTRAVEKRRMAGLPVWDLTESNPTKCGFRAFVGATHGSPLHEPANRAYDPNPRGSIKAREAIAAYYAEKNIRVHPDDIFLTSGTSEAYSLLFHLLCEPGDEVIGVLPVYPLIDHLAAYAGVRIKRLTNFNALSILVGNGHARSLQALTLVNPSNPTGHYVSKDEWRSIDDYCEKNGTAVISDEVFFDFDWQNRPRISGASRNGSLHFTLGGISKMLGMPQMKISWIVLSGPESERRAAAGRLESLCDAFLSVNTPAQNALPLWLKNKDAFVSEVLQRVRSNFQILRTSMAGVGATHGSPLHEPEGGWYATISLPPGQSDEQTALRLLEEKGVLVHPGYLFDLEDERLVISLLPEPGIFEEAVGRFKLI